MALNKSSKKRQAESLIQQNKLVEAKIILKKICKVNRNDYRSWLLLALTNRKLGLYNDAETCCQHVLKRDPEHALAWHLLGSCIHCKGDIQSATSYYEKAIYYNPNLTEAYFFLGNAYREKGQLHTAIKFYKKAISIDSNYLEALANLGASLRETGDLNEARSALNKANKLSPDTPHILCNLALLSMDLDKPDEALIFANKANSINPGFLDSLRILGSIYNQTGNIDSAIHTYQSILITHPDDIGSKTVLASILEKRKKYDESLSLIKPIIESSSYSHEALVTYSRLSENIKVKHDTIKLLLESLENHILSNKEKIDIHYELGRRYDSAQQFEQAFHHYQQANLITRSIYPSLIKNNIKHSSNSNLPNWAKDLNRNDWSKMPVSSNNSQRPIFIVGMHRSGTTLTEQILSSHSSVYGAGEVMIIPNFVSSLKIHPWNNESRFIDTHKQLTTDKLDALANEYLNSDIVASHKQHKVVDNLHYNYANISLIYRIFPNAIIVHISRTPLDNCLSIYFQKFGLTLPYTTDLKEIALFYKQYESLMKYWDSSLNINIINIKYEDLVNDLETTSKKLIKFCGLEWEDNCLNFYNTKRDVNTPSYFQVRRPLYTSSLNRWKHYEAHIKPLLDVFDQ